MKPRGTLLAAIIALQPVGLAVASEPAVAPSTGTPLLNGNLLAATGSGMMQASYDLSPTFDGFKVWLKDQQLEQQRRSRRPGPDVAETLNLDSAPPIREPETQLSGMVHPTLHTQTVLSFGPAPDTDGATKQCFSGSYFGLPYSTWSQVVDENPLVRTRTVGTFQLADGTKFTGEMESGLANGWGVLTQPGGTKLDGEWRDGMPCRMSGTVVVYDGTVERGTWNYVLGTGRGTINWRDGRVYEGPWKNVPESSELPEGSGTLTWPDGHFYVGHFHNGTMHGQGKITYPNGRVVEGIWGKGEFLVAHKAQ